MSEAKMGARVQFCGHDGWFIADIHKVGNVNVVVANGPVTPDNIERPALPRATHSMVDFPVGGYWNPRKGTFVVPEQQVREITDKERKSHDQDSNRKSVSKTVGALH